jgi:(1->4)-alpha-D-glucan 1-alpha-D-glucosylmutase
LIGSWPLEAQDAKGHIDYVTRIKDYMLKAAREAKRRTSWTIPDEGYEQALIQFVEAILDDREGNLFLEDFIPCAQRIARLGLCNSLAQCLLKFTIPGVPDIYQGNELWDLSLVDPDNRRPVDYALRNRLLDELVAISNSPADSLAGRVRSLLETPEDGRMKMYLTWKLLGFRREHPELFRNGDYQALESRGRLAAHLCAFARIAKDETLITVAPRLFDKITEGGAHVPLGQRWTGTWLQAPAAVQAKQYKNILTGEPVHVDLEADTAWLSASEIFASFPVAALTRAV